MPLDQAKRNAIARKVREAWVSASLWGPPAPGEPPRVSMGRRRIRPAIRALCEFASEEPTLTKSQAHEQLSTLGSLWPHAKPRLAIEGGTGLGKTTLAVKKCVEHVLSSAARSLVVVAPSRKRVIETLEKVRTALREVGADPGAAQELLGRQPLDEAVGDTWRKTRFGCMNAALSKRAGTRGRRVKTEVCGKCPWKEECAGHGYLLHTEQALGASVIVTTVQRLGSLHDDVWAGVAGVICDEDVMPGLVEQFWVRGTDLRRAQRYIAGRLARAQRQGRGPSRRLQALTSALPLVRAALDAIRSHGDRGPTPLTMLMPDDADALATEEGVRTLRTAMPHRWKQTAEGRRCSTYSARAPAEWERVKGARMPRQVWGRFLDAMIADLTAGDSARAATVRVEAVGGGPEGARISVLRFDERTIRHLRARPLLLLDATLHPAIGPVLDVERVVLHYQQGRRVVQILTSRLELTTLRERLNGEWRLSARGKWAVRVLAALFAGQRGYVLCRKGLWPLLAKEGARYVGLRRVRLVTPGHERGWDAAKGTSLLVVLGLHAKNRDACEREAQALRSLFLRLRGSTAALDALERPGRPIPYVGRGQVLMFGGEPAERVTSSIADRLGALLQDADRVATVAQFMGRDRSGDSYVFLLRGDPTTPADALVHDSDLDATARPVGPGLACHWLHHNTLGQPAPTSAHPRPSSGR